MAWSEDDDTEVDECYDELIAKKSELESEIQPIQVIITNLSKIKTRQVTSYDSNQQRITTDVPPTDKWGEEMIYEDRLKTKDECIEKTSELLDSDE